jgi:histidinol-phosphate aminotransferase
MVDTGRSGQAVIAALRAKNIFIGRTWPIWPTSVRVSVGTPTEMAKFQTAFKEVMDEPSATSGVHSPFADVRFPQFS